jgi:phage terminase large subunit-like protein
VLRLRLGGQFEGKPFELHPSQAIQDRVAVRLEAGRRQPAVPPRLHREAKGNGKSPLAAGIGHYCLLADGEARAEVYAAARTRTRRWSCSATRSRCATSRRRWPADAVGRQPGLEPGRPEDRLVLPADLVGEAKSGSGPRPSCALCDEVHEHPDGLMIEMLERGFKWRRQPLLVMTTNSGSDRNSVCWQEHQHAIRGGGRDATPDEDATFVGEVIDDDTLLVRLRPRSGDDPLEDPTCWVKANPLLGVTIQPRTISPAWCARRRRSRASSTASCGCISACWTDADVRPG